MFVCRRALNLGGERSYIEAGDLFAAFGKLAGLVKMFIHKPLVADIDGDGQYYTLGLQRGSVTAAPCDFQIFIRRGDSETGLLKQIGQYEAAKIFVGNQNFYLPGRHPSENPPSRLVVPAVEAIRDQLSEILKENKYAAPA